MEEFIAKRGQLSLIPHGQWNTSTHRELMIHDALELLNAEPEYLWEPIITSGRGKLSLVGYIYGLYPQSSPIQAIEKITEDYVRGHHVSLTQERKLRKAIVMHAFNYECNFYGDQLTTRVIKETFLPILDLFQKFTQDPELLDQYAPLILLAISYSARRGWAKNFLDYFLHTSSYGMDLLFQRIPGMFSLIERMRYSMINHWMNSRTHFFSDMWMNDIARDRIRNPNANAKYLDGGSKENPDDMFRFERGLLSYQLIDWCSDPRVYHALTDEFSRIKEEPWLYHPDNYYINRMEKDDIGKRNADAIVKFIKAHSDYYLERELRATEDLAIELAESGYDREEFYAPLPVQELAIVTRKTESLRGPGAPSK